MNRLITACAALAAVSGLTSAALAEDDAIVFEFDYARAQTATPAEAARVYADLKREARKACATGDRMTLLARRIQMECADDLVAKAVSMINTPAMAQVHQNETGDEPVARVALR